MTDAPTDDRLREIARQAVPNRTFSGNVKALRAVYEAGKSCPVTDAEVAGAVEGIKARLSWPSMHWGAEGLHPDALPHIARAALEAVRKVARS